MVNVFTKYIKIFAKRKYARTTEATPQSIGGQYESSVTWHAFV